MGRAARWFRGLFGGKKATAAYRDPAEYPKEKKRWGFVKSFREKESVAVNLPSSFEGEEEQSRRAIAVAAATAAAAEAAVAAAQAAAAVVRLTGGGERREEFAAAVKIQAAFRGYLARRALRALKSLVKLQAIVRGNIVRKQAAETLRCMQALVRVQARARACRALQSDRNQRKLRSRPHPGPPTPEKFEQPVRSNACKPKRSSSLKRSTTSKQSIGNEEFRWLNQWVEDRYWDDEKNAKILEIDTGKSNTYTRSPLMSSSNPFSRSYTTIPDSPSKDSTVAQYSIPSPSSVNMSSPLRFHIVDGCEYEDCSPQFFSATSSRVGPFTPVKSECSRSVFSGYSECPSYMAYTESSRAKVRSQSAPKQRPEFEKSGSTKRLSGSVQRSLLHAKFTNKAYPGSGRLDRLGMPVRM